jgi:hypothetical protein
MVIGNIYISNFNKKKTCVVNVKEIMMTKIPFEENAELITIRKRKKDKKVEHQMPRRKPDFTFLKEKFSLILSFALTSS